jgi:hypothetical protein
MERIFMDNIQNYDQYNKRMELSLIDKVFFADKIPNDISLIVDYGCADGTLTGVLKCFFTNATIIGYDIDEKMIDIAKNKNPHVMFLSSLKEIDHIRAKSKGKDAVIISSIIHEIYSYCKPKEISDFWNYIYFSDFNYVCVRDMMVSMSVDRSSDMNDVVKVLRKYHRTKELMDFQANWGNIENNKNLIHFLLKYKYMQPNWEREVKENYIPVYREDFLSQIPCHYEIIFHEHYSLPYLKEQIKADMNLTIKDPTHIKLILSLQNT